jgi:hypothetical protein
LPAKKQPKELTQLTSGAPDLTAKALNKSEALFSNRHARAIIGQPFE